MQEIVLSSEKDANAVRDNLRKLLDMYEQVSVGDYLELVGISSTYSDEKLGWTELGDIPVKPVTDGFVLELPEPQSFSFGSTSAFPFLKGWWIVVDVIDDQKYEGRLVDVIGGTMIIESEPSKIRLGIKMNAFNKIDAYRERPNI